MDLNKWVRLAKAAGKLAKRPDTAFLAGSAVLLALLEAFWAFQDVQFTIEAIALLVFSAFCMALAAGIALRRRDTDAWKPFGAVAGASFFGLLVFSDLWPFYAFPAACAFLSAYLYTTGGRDAA